MPPHAAALLCLALGATSIAAAAAGQPLPPAPSLGAPDCVGDAESGFVAVGLCADVDPVDGVAGGFAAFQAQASARLPGRGYAFSWSVYADGQKILECPDPRAICREGETVFGLPDRVCARVTCVETGPLPHFADEAQPATLWSVGLASNLPCEAPGDHVGVILAAAFHAETQVSWSDEAAAVFRCA